jgi:two-component system, OmpR family, sensor kinase
MTAQAPGVRNGLAGTGKRTGLRNVLGLDTGLRSGICGRAAAPGLREALAVAVMVALLISITSSPNVLSTPVMDQVTTALALVAVAVSAMSAVFAGMFGRLSGDSRGTWLCVAFSFYSLVGIPAATIGATVRWSEAAMGNARIFAHTALGVLLFIAAVPPRVVPRWSAWFTLVLGLLLAVILAVLGSIFPSESLGVTTAASLRTSLATALLFSPIPLGIVAYSRGSAPLYRVGLASEVVAIAHFFRVRAGTPDVPLGLTFSTLRLFGLLLLMLSTIQLTRHSLQQVDRTQCEQQEELRLAEFQLQQVAERDHELRNGLAGLAGATRLLTTRADEAPTLQCAVASELVRLEAVLRGVGAGRAASQLHSYLIDRVLAEQAALRNSAGMNIRLDTNPGLWAVGSPATLAHVMANLLGNCAQHAPGSPVRVQARSTGSTVTIRISDSGPGVPNGAEQEVFKLGTHSEHSDGEGIGLHVSRRMLEAEGGTISIAPRRANCAGCTVIIELPAATEQQLTLASVYRREHPDAQPPPHT